MSDRAERITVWLREKVSASGTRGLIFGLSGGIDSAVVARLCQLALPQRVLGLIMPCYSHPQDEEDARLVAEAFAIPCVTLDLNATFDSLTEALHGAIRGLPTAVSVADIKQQVPEANLKPRLRMTTLYFVANSLNYLVAGTGNRSEIALGYFTKYGDGGVDVLPIGSLLKSEVRQLARDIGVPGRIIDKPPSAGLWVGQTDEAEMGFTYEQLEGYLTRGPAAVPAAIGSRIERLRAVSEHKRALPPIGPS